MEPEYEPTDTTDSSTTLKPTTVDTPHTQTDKYCKLSNKSKDKQHCILTKNENENDTKNCLYNEKSKRCNTKEVPTEPKNDIKFCKLSDKKTDKKTKKYCIITNKIEENDTESCKYNQKTNRCKAITK